MSHYEKRLASDLEAIQEAIGEMAGHVETALENSMRALLEGDQQLANLTVLRDNRINRASRAIDLLCHAFIARHLPGAGHLRLMSSVIRLNVALERIGDYAVTISRESLQLSRPPQGTLARELDRVADESRRLLHQSIVAFREGNADAAAATIPLVEHIENMMDGIYAELIEESTSRSPREIVAAFVVFSLLKRISDQAKNICEQTLFAVEGKRKKTKRFRILFIDDDNAVGSQMARAVARKGHVMNGHFDSAGLNPAASPDPALLAFLEGRGIDTDGARTRALTAMSHDIKEYDVVVSLARPVRDYLSELPFHTTALEWNVDAALTESEPATDEARLEAMYRYLRTQIDDLMETLAGPGGSNA